MVVVDTDILIAAIRNNEIAKSILKKYSGSNIYISLITEMELYIGATNTSKKWAVEKIIETHQTLPLNKYIGEMALKLIKQYNNKTQSLFLSDALIAATYLHHNYRLITFNTKDFKVVKGLQFAK